MRIWLIGADQAGSEALRQLKKNPAVTVVVSDAADRPKAVSDGVIARVDMVESVTPVTASVPPMSVSIRACWKTPRRWRSTCLPRWNVRWMPKCVHANVPSGWKKIARRSPPTTHVSSGMGLPVIMCVRSRLHSRRRLLHESILRVCECGCRIQAHHSILADRAK